jgi:hypothetical protein
MCMDIHMKLFYDLGHDSDASIAEFVFSHSNLYMPKAMLF